VIPKFNLCPVVEKNESNSYRFIFNILALMATSIVLMLISAASAAGLNNRPWLYKTPAANGRAIGQIVSDYPNSKDDLNFAGLDYKVEKRKLFVETNKFSIWEEENRVQKIEVPNFLATIRTDTQQVLGIVGNDYEVVQNTDAFNFFDTIVDGEGIQYETAGALGNGERIFITAKLPGYIKVGSDDLIEKYLFLTTSHDGFGSITAAFTPIRIVARIL
jgi:phage/plasmid-like protein (TIGR03299 family)